MNKLNATAQWLSLACLLVTLSAFYRSSFLTSHWESIYSSSSRDEERSEVVPQRLLADAVPAGDKKHPHHYHERLYGHNFTDSGHSYHMKPWMIFETVDGLQNDDVVMVITSTSQQTFLRERYAVLAYLRSL